MNKLQQVGIWDLQWAWTLYSEIFPLLEELSCKEKLPRRQWDPNRVWNAVSTTGGRHFWLCYRKSCPGNRRPGLAINLKKTETMSKYMLFYQIYAIVKDI